MNFVASMEDAIPFMSLGGQHKTGFPSLSHIHPSPHPPDMRLSPHKDEQPPVEARPLPAPTVGHPTTTSVLAWHQRWRHEPLPRTCPCQEQ